MKVGIDIVEIGQIPTGPSLDKFLNKYFSSKEIEYIKTKCKKEQTIAGIFAAKEAFLKALEIGIGAIKLSSVEVLHKTSGAPYINLTEEILNYLKPLKLTNIEISISHAKDYAVAICNII